MNTVKKGDEFEAKSYNIIYDALCGGQLGIISNQCRIFKKKGYYSKDRESNIIFDLTIEVWPPMAKNYTLLYIIECKNYSHKVPINDIEEFHSKIGQVTGSNVKGIFITNNDYQKGAFTFGKSKGMMLIKVNYDDSYNIILHKIYRHSNQKRGNYSEIESFEEALEAELTTIFDNNSKITGLEKLSKGEIDKTAKQLLYDINPDILNKFQAVPFENVISYIKEKFKTTFTFNEVIKDKHGNKILGCYSQRQNKIYIDDCIVFTDRYPFILCHEIGHLLLHSQLKINQRTYDSFNDSEYDFELGKYDLKNPRNWIEWQANQFAASITMPDTTLIAKVIRFQDHNSIRNKGTIYCDHQKINQQDFHDIITHLSSFLKVSKTNIIYRLKDLGILKYGDDPMHISQTRYFNQIKDAWVP